MALVVAIGFLAILSILGALVYKVSTSGLMQAGMVTPDRQALYAGDRAVEYSLNRDIVVSLTTGESIDLFNNVKRDVTGTVVGATINHQAVINGGGGGRLVAGTVTDLGPNALPPAISARYGSDFGANFYHVEVEAEAQAAGQAESKIDASIIRLFKMDDDTIFRTSEKG